MGRKPAEQHCVIFLQANKEQVLWALGRKPFSFWGRFKPRWGKLVWGHGLHGAAWMQASVHPPSVLLQLIAMRMASNRLGWHCMALGKPVHWEVLQKSWVQRGNWKLNWMGRGKSNKWADWDSFIWMFWRCRAHRREKSIYWNPK